MIPVAVLIGAVAIKVALFAATGPVAAPINLTNPSNLLRFTFAESVSPCHKAVSNCEAIVFAFLSANSCSKGIESYIEPVGKAFCKYLDSKSFGQSASFTLILPTVTVLCVKVVEPDAVNPQLPPAWNIASVSIMLIVSALFTPIITFPALLIKAAVFAPKTESVTNKASFCSVYAAKADTSNAIVFYFYLFKIAFLYLLILSSLMLFVFTNSEKLFGFWIGSSVGAIESTSINSAT